MKKTWKSPSRRIMEENTHFEKENETIFGRLFKNT